ncbi:hypothetical protein D3C86_2139510 [compost metagenome]
MVIKKILAKIGAQNTPVSVVVDIVRLAAIHKRYVKRAVGQKVVSTHRNRLTGRANGVIGLVPG